MFFVSAHACVGKVEIPSFVAVCRSCWKSDMELSLRKYGKGVLIRGKISEEEAFLTHHST